MPAQNNWIIHEIIWNLDDNPNILIAYLSDFEINGIEELHDRLRIVYNAPNVTEKIKNICTILYPSAPNHVINYQEEKNWNQIWESSFDPIYIDDFVVIHAPFHTINGSAYDHTIEINPKMSFGTGHHPTTRMMVKQMQQIDMENKSVFDFGTGTGILAILAEKLGAVRILGTDKDTIAIENSSDNASKNGCKQISFKQANRVDHTNHFDIILVNIVRQVILDNFDAIAARLLKQGILVLSGYLQHDKERIHFEAKNRGFRLIRELEEDNWVSQAFEKLESS